MSEPTIDDICSELAKFFPDLLNIHLDIDDSFLSEYGSAALERTFVEWALHKEHLNEIQINSSYFESGDDICVDITWGFDNHPAVEGEEARAPTREEALVRAVWEVVEGERE